MSINELIYNTYYVTLKTPKEVVVDEDNIKAMLDLLFANEFVFRTELFDEKK